jgi:serine/threonine protein kinase
MASSTPCPDSATLVRFLRGQLPPEEVEARAAHVEQCPECVAQMQSMLDQDTLENALRNHGQVQSHPALERIRQAMNATAPRDTVGAATLRLEEAAADQVLILAPALQAGELGRLGPYRILKVLGQGGMGTVYEAEDDVLKRRVALKVMKPSVAASPARDRFQREARLMASLKHDHIATIFQVGEDRGTPYLAMELLQGETLEDRLEKGPLPLSETLRIGTQIARGLEAAHQRGLIHRDIKPANIWLETRGQPTPAGNAETEGTRRREESQETVRDETGGTPPEPPPADPPSLPAVRVKILDFGLARPAKEEETITGSGVVVGTPSYMAPEQAQGEPVDSLCDLYSLGCILYRMVTGQLPVQGKSVMAILSNLATSAPRRPREHDPAIPVALEGLILALLAKNPAERPPRARAIIVALQAIERDPQAPTTPFGRAPDLPRSRRRRYAVWGVVLLLLIGAMYFFVHRFIVDRGDKEPLALKPDAGESKPRLIQLKVPANQFWTPTNLYLKNGMVVEITASGKVDAAADERPYYHDVPPEGREERIAQVPQPQLPGLCLLGKIAPAQVFYVGAKIRIPVDPSKEGELFLGINDDIVDDNSGDWDVRIIVHPPPAGTKK